MATGLKMLVLLSPAILGLVSGLLFEAGARTLSLVLFGVYCLAAGVVCAVIPERVRAFSLSGASFDAWSPFMKWFVSEQVSIPGIRFSGAIAFLIGGLLLWGAVYGLP